MGAATGDITPRENVAMVRELRRLYALLLACPTCWASGRVKWAHVKSHTEHKWNDRADALATLGYTLTVRTSRVPGERWRKVRIDGHLTPPIAHSQLCVAGSPARSKGLVISYRSPFALSREDRSRGG